jgi:hypothetical protein
MARIHRKASPANASGSMISRRQRRAPDRGTGKPRDRVEKPEATEPR